MRYLYDLPETPGAGDDGDGDGDSPDIEPIFPPDDGGSVNV
jgi:hypothetical protein